MECDERISMNSICVFCSSSNSIDDIYVETATDLGHRIGQLGLDLVYGGASIGLMGAVARATHEKGGRVVGVIPEFFRKTRRPQKRFSGALRAPEFVLCYLPEIFLGRVFGGPKRVVFSDPPRGPLQILGREGLLRPGSK